MGDLNDFKVPADWCPPADLEERIERLLRPKARRERAAAVPGKTVLEGSGDRPGTKLGSCGRSAR
jgi:hypothetical protein